MPILMTARCNQCGHENNPEYRFCGVCGAPLPPGVPVREPERANVSSVGGPSFLGLGDDRSSDLDYLLEEETPRGHGRMYMALLLLVLSAGLLAWHWQRDGYPWDGLAHFPGGSKAAASSSSQVPASATQPAPAIATPPPADTSSSNGTLNGTAAATPNGTPTGDPAQPAPGEPTANGTVSPNPIAVVNPQPADGSGAGDSIVAAPAVASAASPQVQDQVRDLNQNIQNKDASAAGAVEDSVPKETPEVPVAPVKKPVVVKPSPTVRAVSAEDRLVDEGERYLYGRGVRPDCALAQRNLMIGARQSNPKAQTLLGAMYATGHCVNRDLPSAYRWFAKALHGDPSNSRVQRDLEVLWKQMTPEERLLAMKDR